MPLIASILRLLGAEVTTMTREQAAAWILQRDLIIEYRPVIIDGDNPATGDVRRIQHERSDCESD